MPKVSVIVPIYNVEKYLEKCINSLLSQTLEDIQIILVNDGSKDNSGNIAKEYEQNNKDRVIYVEKENGGLSDARNYGLKYATGDFIAFLDSDDYIEKNAYEEMYNKAIEENADYVECDFIWEFPNKIRVDKQYPYKNKKEMLSFVRVVAWNKLIKRQLITDNNLEFPKGLRYEVGRARRGRKNLEKILSSVPTPNCNWANLFPRPLSTRRKNYTTSAGKAAVFWK